MLKRLFQFFSRGYDAGDWSRMHESLPFRKRTDAPEDFLLGDGTRDLLRQKGNDLRRNNAIVAGACERLALFTIGAHGIKPQAKTNDDGWNDEAEAFWNRWSRSCDSRGRVSLYDLQNMAVSLRPTHGGLYLQKLSDGTIRPIETERIRQPKDKEMAKNYIDGVCVDGNGEVQRYCVHSRDKSGEFSGEREIRYIKSDEIIPVIKSAWRPDQVREVPDLAPIIPLLTDIGAMNKYTLNTAKVQSMVVGFLKKQGGQLPNAFARGTQPAAVPGGVRRQKMDWGELLEGLPGDDFDMKASPTPNSNYIPFVKLQLALCASALSVPYEFLTLDLAGLDYSRMKGCLLFINFACRPWKTWIIDKMLTPLWNWRIAKAMATGEISKAPVKNGVSQWMKVDWQAPEEPWIDRQEAQQADVLEIQAGLNTLGRASQRRGNDLEEVLRDKAREIKLIKKIADEEGIDVEDLSFMQIPGQTNSGSVKEGRDE